MTKTNKLLSGFGGIEIAQPITQAKIDKGLKILNDTETKIKEAVVDFDQSKLCPNRFPTIKNVPYKISIIGEAPGRDEHYQGQPFVGISGRLLTQFLSKANIIREACFIGNICQYRPANNDISTFAYDGPQITHGLNQLKIDLDKFDPNIVLLLGKTALYAALGKSNIGDWRGSFFISQIPGPFYGRKCIASYHPAACLRQWEWSPLLMFDIKRCKEESLTKTFTPPLRDLRATLSFHELLTELDNVILTKPLISCDIEGWVHTLQCCSIATSPNYSFIVPFTNLDKSNYWPTLEEEYEVTKRFVAIMSDHEIKKIWQNGLYDRFVLQYGFDIFVAGSVDDTMVKTWEWQCELEKSIGFQASVLTKEPYWKFERKEAISGH